MSRRSLVEGLIALLFLTSCGYFFSKQFHQVRIQDLTIQDIRPGMSRENVVRLKGKPTATFKCDDSEDGNREGLLFGSGPSGIICIHEKEFICAVIGTELKQSDQQLAQIGDLTAKVRARLDSLIGKPVTEGYDELIYEQNRGRLKLTFKDKALIKIELRKY